MNMVLTEGKKTKEVGDLKIRVTFQIHDLGQGPYFSATGETWTRSRGGDYWLEATCGCIHDTIAQYFPEYEKYLKWHLWHLDRGPWCYLENALYWAGKKGWCDGKPNSPPNAYYFKRHIAYGVVDGEDFADELTNEAMLAATEDEIVETLKDRLPAAMRAFRLDMAVLFGENLHQIMVWSKTK